ncbi:MAG: LysM peptidoglycan-binding domain-containing protein, partial [Acidobacteriota bacterium]
VVESVSQEFLLFSPNGTPLRAKLALSLKEAWTVEQQLTETGRHSSDRTKLIAVQSGQTLSQIAAREYDDPGAWRIIAEWNGIEDPAELEPGTMLVIPKNTPGAEAKGGDRG